MPLLSQLMVKCMIICRSCKSFHCAMPTVKGLSMLPQPCLAKASQGHVTSLYLPRQMAGEAGHWQWERRAVPSIITVFKCILCMHALQESLWDSVPQSIQNCKSIMGGAGVSSIHLSINCNCWLALLIACLCPCHPQSPGLCRAVVTLLLSIHLALEALMGAWS